MIHKLLKNFSNPLINHFHFSTFNFQYFNFLIFQFFLLLPLPTCACIWEDTHNFYLFNVCGDGEFSDRANEITLNNWKAYLGVDSTEYFWYDSERIIAAAEARGDALMAGYVRYLDKYLECSNSVSSESWHYPTKEELAERKRTLSEVRLYAQSKLRTRLRSQHALLFMRCNMLLGLHEQNVSFWQQTASQYIETVYKDMMQNIYAGALLHTGQIDEACRIFAAQGDWRSLMTHYYQRRSYAAIRAEYERDANSPVLPFLLQDFVNNTQEAADVNYTSVDVGGKLFIRDISRAEAAQMCQLAESIVASGASQQPALWQTARAWIEYLLDRPADADAHIRQALTLDGTPRQHDVARVIAFFIRSQRDPLTPAFDDYVAGELTWLSEMSATDNFFDRATNRTVHQVLADRYSAAGRGEISLAIRAATHATTYLTALDTVSVDVLLRYIAYAQDQSSQSSPLDSALRPLGSAASLSEEFSARPNGTLDPSRTFNSQFSTFDFHDLIGTKYLRLCRWEEAASYLAAVPASYYAAKGWAPYAATRSITIEPWIRRQLQNDDGDDDESEAPEDATLTINPKLAFAREMQQLEAGLGALKASERQQRCMDLAVRYAQAHFTGDCWWLMRDLKSVYDTLRVNEADLRLRATDLLRQAAKGPDAALCERALFALSYVYLNTDCWRESRWDSDACEYVPVLKPNSAHYAAWAALADFERKNKQGPAPYVSRCDEYKQFMKQYKP